MLIEGVEYLIDDEEKEKFLQIIERHKEICFSIHKKKQISKIIETKLKQIQKNYNENEKEIKLLLFESEKLQTILGLKAKPSIIVKHNIYYIIKKLRSMDEIERQTWLLKHSEEAETFLNFNFDNLISHKPKEIEEKEIEEEENILDYEQTGKEIEEQIGETVRQEQKIGNREFD